MRLVDRHQERAVLDGLVAATRCGESGALVLRGEPGVGLTTLLEHTVDAAAEMRVTRVAGVESEVQLPYAGVHQVVTPMLDSIESLPSPQRSALQSVFGLVEGDVSNGFLVGLAVLTLLSEGATEEHPHLLLVDDAQWLDQPSLQTLAFVARRTLGDYLGLVFAVREPTDGRMQLDGIPVLRVAGLAVDAARELLTLAVPGPLDERVRDRLVVETSGNPLALVELVETLSAEQLAGEASLPDALPLGERLEDGFLRQYLELPGETRTLLLLAAAGDSLSAAVLLRAAEQLGIPADAIGPAETSRLVRVDENVVFRHSLLRSSIYADAPLSERQRVHRALAEVDVELDAERRAWHLALATPGVDGAVATALAAAARQVSARGDHGGAAKFLERAARLTPRLEERSALLLEAAQSELDDQMPSRAAVLLAQAQSHSLSDALEARALRLRGAIAFSLGQSADSAALLLRAARALEPHDAQLSRRTYLEALEAAIYAGRLGSGGMLLTVARAARAAPAPERPATAADLLLDGLSSLFVDGAEAAVPVLHRAIAALRPTDEARFLTLGCLAAMEIWDDDGLQALATRQVELARETGSLTALSLALDQLAGMVDLVAGRFEAADARFAEARARATAARDPQAARHATAGELVVAAWSGSEVEARRLAAACLHDAVARGVGRYVTFARYALAVLENGLGHYEAATAAALDVCEDRALYLVSFTLPELVEAGVRSGEREVAEGALTQLAARTLPSGTDWALGTLARSRALLQEGSRAEELYRSAIEHFERCRSVPSLARAHLVFGEWLRRERRRREARGHLAQAHGMLLSMGAHAFAERARIELTATGGPASSRVAARRADGLTAQELQVARLAADGATNPEIGAQLFISPRTVEYHLHKVYRKLHLSSRTQLARAVFAADEDD